MLHELSANFGQIAHAHIKDDGLPWTREHTPVHVQTLAIAEMAGGQYQGCGVITVSEGNSRGRCRSLGGRQTRYDGKRNPCTGQGFGFLAATSEDIAVTSLEAHDVTPRAGQAHHQFNDVVLRQCVA